MARQVLPIVGAVVGFYFGGPQGAQWGYAIGSVIGNAVDPLTLQGPKIGDNGVQTSAEGAFRPILYGTGPIVGNVITRGNRQIKKKKERQDKGGPVTETEHVYWTFQIRIGEPVQALLRIWEDEKLVYDVRPESQLVAESTEYAKRFRFYDGNDTQMPDPDLEVFLGMGNVSAYRGTAHIVFPNYDLTDRRESIPNYRFECTSNATIEPVIAMLAVASEGSGSGYGTIPSEDGTDWEDPIQNPGLFGWNPSTLIGGPDRYVAMEPARVSYSLDRGGSWQLATGLAVGGNSGAHGCFVRAYLTNDPLYLVPQGTEGIYRSTDNSLTYTKVASHSATHVRGRTELLTSFYTPIKSLRQSTDDGLTWGSPITLAHEGATFGENVASDPGIGGNTWIGGRLTTFNNLNPRLSRIEAGPTQTLEAIPAFVNSNQVTAVCFADGILFIGTDTGELAYKDNTGWHLCAQSAPYPIYCITHNGDVFVVGYANAGIPYGGGILYGANPASLTSAPLDSALAGVYLLAALSPDEPVADGHPVPLSSIVASIHGRANQSASKFDVSELTDLVDGIVLAQEFTCADAIRTIIAPYMSDASEYSKKIHYIKRGKPVVRTLSIDDLVDLPEDTMRDNQIEYPAKLHMFFQNPVIGYAPAKATTTRSSPDILVVGERTIQIPVVIDDVNEAAQISDKLMKIAWAEASGESNNSISDAYMDLVPADCVGLFLRGQLSRKRIVKIEDTPGVRKLTLRNDRQSAYTSNVTGIPLPDPTPPLPTIAGLTILGVLDIPALTDADDDLHYLVAATGQTEAWSGAEVQRRLSQNTQFDPIAQFNTNTAMGLLLEDVADASEWYPDTTNVVRIQLYLEDEIDSLTDAQWLSEGGGFALEKADGSWEVMQYRDALDEGDGVYSLSHLQRGRLNSGPSEHLAGRRFVLFDFLRKIPAMTAWLETDLSHRAVSYTTTPDTAAVQTETYHGRSQIEFPPASLTLARDVDTISGIVFPRHRFGTEDNPIRSINWTGYRWNLTDGSNTLQFDGTADREVFDLTGWASPVTVTVAQINRLTGPGPSISESIA